MSSRQAPARAGQRLLRRHRLRQSSDFVRCYRRGRRHHGSLITLHVVRNDCGHPRFGITASRKVGRAVVRFRLKRRLREIYRRWEERERLPAVDLVAHLHPAAAHASFAELREETEGLLRRLTRKGPNSSESRTSRPGS